MGTEDLGGLRPALCTGGSQTGSMHGGSRSREGRRSETRLLRDWEQGTRGALQEPGRRAPGTGGGSRGDAVRSSLGVGVGAAGGGGGLGGGLGLGLMWMESPRNC